MAKRRTTKKTSGKATKTVSLSQAKKSTTTKKTTKATPKKKPTAAKKKLLTAVKKATKKKSGNVPVKDSNFIRISENAKAERFVEMGKKVQNREVVWAYYAIDGRVGYHYYKKI
jgi:hypothetical protein